MFVSSNVVPDKGAIVAFIAGALPTIAQIAALACPAGRATAHLLLTTALLAAGGAM